MATTDLRAESALHNHPFAIPSPAAAAVTRIMSRYGRERLAVFVTVAIDLMDMMDGDPDFEVGGDDEPLRAEGHDEQDDFDEDGHDQEAIDEREPPEGDACVNAPIWPGEGGTAATH